MIRIMPNIPKIQARWAHRASEIPDWLEVPMADGSVVKYYPHVEQPSFRKSMEIIQHMTDPKNGYKKTGDAATSTGRRTNNTVVIVPQKGQSENEKFHMGGVTDHVDLPEIQRDPHPA